MFVVDIELDRRADASSSSCQIAPTAGSSDLA